MKIALSGKGGSGKTTIAAGIAKIYSENFKVLAIDADSSLNLSMFFGHEDIAPISEMRDVVEEKARLSGGLVRMNPDVRDMIDKYSVKINGTNKGNTYSLIWDNLLIDDDIYETQDGKVNNNEILNATDISSYENDWLSNNNGFGVQNDYD